MRNDQLFNYAKNGYQKFFYVIDKKNYLFRTTFISADGIVVDFEKDAIKELYINDVYNNPFKDGYIVIDNREDVIERYVSTNNTSEFSTQAFQRGYRTRGDARDLVLLTIIPIDPSQNPYNEQSLTYNKFFGFQYVFILSDEQDIDDKQGKVKKYNLIDCDEQVLKEKKIFLSSAKINRKENTPYLSDFDRKAFTGDIMKEILNLGLQSPGSVYTVLSGNETITPYFEQGASKLFYSSPNNSTAFDDLNYVYGFHVSNSPYKDFSILQKDNFTGEYTLQSVGDLFTLAFDKQNDSGGKAYIENLTITGSQDVNNVIQNDIKKPLRALEFGETGDVLSAKFFNTPGTEYKQRIKTTLVHAYNFQQKLFSIDGVTGNIENVKKDFTSFYSQPMKGRNNNPTPNLILTNTQKTNVNYDNKFLIYSEDGDYLKLSVGRNQLLKDALTLNIGVELTVPGGMHRKAGKFISIDRKGSYIDNDFDNKFLGIYLILGVEHLFVNSNQYVNKILAVKTYLFNDPKFNENVP